MIFEKLIIKNFQSWNKLEITFSENVNILVGLSDSGKSAIFRAMYWVVFNRPLGDAFRTWDTKETSVTLITNKHVIKRVKGDKQNYYELDGAVFKAFGQEPPDEIKDAFGIDRKLNIQTQTDPIFMLSESPGQVAQYLNDIANLSKIDTTVKKGNSLLKRIISSLDSELKKEEKLQNQIDDFPDFTQTKNLIAKIYACDHTSRQNEKEIYLIDRLLNRLKESKNKLNNKNELKKLKELIKQKERINEYQENLKKTHRNLSDKVKDIIYLQEVIEKTNYKKTKKLMKELILLNTGNDIHKGLIQETRNVLDRINECQETVKNLQKKLKEHKQNLKENMPNVCPLCEQEIKENV